MFNIIIKNIQDDFYIVGIMRAIYYIFKYRG
jgi:hypothetical protein